jgi:hypothetical protein
MMMCLAVAWSVALLASTVDAYTGGPALVDVLGWDAHMQRVYVHTLYQEESYTFGPVYYFDLRSSHPQRRMPVAWSRPAAAADDSLQSARVAALRRRLRRLDAMTTESLPSWPRTIQTDTITACMDRVARFRIRPTFATMRTFELVTYQDHDCCAKDVFRIPQRAEELWVLAFRGNPCDPAETEVPVLVTPADSHRPIVVEAWTR